MWAKLKRLCDLPSSRAAMEILKEDGTVSTYIKEILERWHQDISRLCSDPMMALNEEFYQEIKNKKDEFEIHTNNQKAEPGTRS